jgi:hypothetical protein
VPCSSCATSTAAGDRRWPSVAWHRRWPAARAGCAISPTPASRGYSRGDPPAAAAAVTLPHGLSPSSGRRGPPELCRFDVAVKDLISALGGISLGAIGRRLAELLVATRELATAVVQQDAAANAGKATSGGGASGRSPGGPGAAADRAFRPCSGQVDQPGLPKTSDRTCRSRSRSLPLADRAGRRHYGRSRPSQLMSGQAAGGPQEGAGHGSLRASPSLTQAVPRRRYRRASQRVQNGMFSRSLRSQWPSS